MATATASRVEKLPVLMKVGYGFGDFANQFVYTTIAIYFMYFFTDVALLGAAAGGLILFIARGWDAFADMFMGYIADHTRSRWGQKRPYLLFSSLPLGLFLFLLFASPPIAEEYRFAYYLVVAVLTWTLYSVASIPYNALIPNLTLDSGERSSLAGYKMFFTIIAILLIGALTKPMVARYETEAAGFRMVALIYGAVVFVSYLVVFFSVRERIHVSETERYGFREIFKLIAGNKPFIILSAATFCGFIAVTVLGACINYYFKYNMKNESFIPIAFTCIFGFAALGLPLWVFLSNRIGKKKVFIISSIIYGAALLCIYFIRDFDTRIMFPVFIVTGLTYSGIQLCQWSMIPDTVEYSQYLTGRRPEGIIYGVYTFILKMAVAVGSIIVGSGLDLAGYVANVEQSEGSLFGIRVMMSLIPFAVTMVSVIVLYFYPITEKSHREMLSEIERRKGG